MPLTVDQKTAMDAIAADPNVTNAEFEEAAKATRAKSALGPVAVEVAKFLSVTITDWPALAAFVRRTDFGGSHPSTLYEPLLLEIKRALVARDQQALGAAMLLLVLAVRHD